MGKTKQTITGDLILGVDFDGNITTEPDMGKKLVLQPNCKDVLLSWYEKGYTLVLWTCRTGPSLDEALSFLLENDLFSIFTSINDQVPLVVTKYHPHVARKLGADIYFDDKNAMTTVNWLDYAAFVEDKIKLEGWVIDGATTEGAY